MKNEEVHLGGNYGKDGIATIYGLAVYFGHKDPRNISAKCSYTVKDVDGAELEALVCFLEWCSTHGHNEPCNFAVRTSSSALMTWILVHLPTYKEYGWTHTEQDESIPYEEILRYVDALLDQIPIHPQSPKLSFSLIPAHAVVDGNGHALKLAKKAVAVNAAIKSREWEALTYVARVDIVHTITSPAFTSSAKEMEDAMLRTQQARARFDSRRRTPHGEPTVHRGRPKVEEKEVTSVDDSDAEVEAAAERRNVATSSDEDDENPRERSTKRRNSVVEERETISVDTSDEEGEKATTSEDGDERARGGYGGRVDIAVESSLPPPVRKSKTQCSSPSPGSMDKKKPKPVAPAKVKANSYPAHVKSSKEWKKILGQDTKDNRMVFAQLCEQVVPNFVRSQATWQKIHNTLRQKIWSHLLRLRYLPKVSMTSKAGAKRQCDGEDLSNRPTKKQKTSLHSDQPTSCSKGLTLDATFLNKVILRPINFTEILCSQENGEEIGLIVVFQNDRPIDNLKYYELDHLPHLVAAMNKDGKRRVTLVTFPRRLLNQYTEGMPKSFSGQMTSFALNKSSYEHDEELVELLRKVPQPCNSFAK